MSDIPAIDLEWTRWIYGCKIREKVVLYTFYRYLRSIDVVVVRLYELYSCLARRDECFYGTGAFVVEDME